MLTGDQIQESIDVKTLLDTTTDFLRFVTEYFQIISRSGPHIYHSALLLSPLSSIVRKLYGQYINSPVSRVVSGLPNLWDSCTASADMTTAVRHAVWSPCGQFLAVCFTDMVGIWDSTTLAGVSDLRPPTNLAKATPGSLAFSPDGCLLACTYDPVREPDL